MQLRSLTSCAVPAMKHAYPPADADVDKFEAVVMSGSPEPPRLGPASLAFQMAFLPTTHRPPRCYPPLQSLIWSVSYSLPARSRGMWMQARASMRLSLNASTSRSSH